MLRFGVVLVAIAVLFTLTALAVAASGKIGHPFRVAAALGALLLLGLALLAADSAR